MSCDCPTCCCDHAGTFPKFSLFYTDGSVIHGGGLDDRELVVYAWPRSWIEAPAMGLGCATSFDEACGRRWHRGAEMVYALPFQARGGADVTQTGAETRLVPMVSGHLGIVKLGEHQRTERFHELMRAAKLSSHVPQQSAISPFELEDFE